MFKKNKVITLLMSLLLITGSVWADESDTLIEQAQNLLNQGQYYLAVDKLQTVQNSTQNPEQQLRAQGMLGLVYYRMHRYEQADSLLTKALASSLGSKRDKAHWTAALADSMNQHAKSDEAAKLYAQALALAVDDTKLTLGIRLEQVSLLPKTQQLSALQTIGQQLTTIPAEQERLPYLLNIALKASDLGADGVAVAYSSFEQVRQNAGQQPRVLAQALGGLADLYEKQNRLEEALQLNSQAIDALQNAPADDLLIDLQWRQGRLFHAQHQDPQALVAYQRAIEHVEAIRQDIPVEYHNGRSSFRDTLEPIYLGLADLLLKQASGQQGESKTQSLRKARETVELIKQSEVEDFLGGRCGVQSDKNTLLETIATDTAIIYPILLPERLELLVSSGNEIQQYTQNITAKALQTLIQSMVKNLHHGITNKQLGQQLYAQLIAPLEPWLKQRQVQTLVIVPDSTLRLLPLAALYDGQQYLIERYALASSPGLTLMKPESTQSHKLKVLLAGLSKPGSVIEHLPPVFLQEVAAIKGQKKPVLDSSDTVRSVELEQLMRSADFQQQVKDKLSLPAVAQEIKNLSGQVPSTVLMNEQFTVDHFKQQLSDAPYGIVHIASHGIFGKTAASSFVMAYDDIIDMNMLEALFKAEKFKKQPIDLLTLNACETAEGDDRSPMGLSGVAIKTNVRSALGTLWSVSDEASFQMISVFYKALSQDKMTKVKALQQAQLSLLHNPAFQSPVFWAPFILVGNWL